MQCPEGYPDRSVTPSEARRRFLKLLGDLPREQYPLQLHRGRKVDLGDGLLQERIVYMADGDETIPAYLYTHADKQQRPGIIAVHPHGGSNLFPLGKDHICEPSAVSTSAYAYRAARAGFTVLAPDSLCFGERRNFSGFSKEFAYEIIRTMEYFSRGSSLAWKNCWDLMRAVDVLQSLKEVDSDRIGMMGHSGGSIQTYIATACDDRIKAACAFQSFITLRHQFYAYKLYHCLYPYVPNMVSAGIDFDQVVAAIVPRKLFMGWGRQDEGTPAVMTQAFVKAISQESSRGNYDPCVELFTSDGAHEITEPMLQAALQFLQRELELD